MKYSDKIIKQVQDSIDVKTKLLEMGPTIESAGIACANALRNGNKILLCGNGGSAADAQHIAAELVVRYKGGNERRALPAMTLSPDPSTITACGNDYGYDRLFARQVEAFGNEGDVLIGISTSGNSLNVINAIDEAKIKKLKTISLLGKNGGKIKNLTDIEIVVPSMETARIQESHILIGHILCSIVEKELFNLD